MKSTCFKHQTFIARILGRAISQPEGLARQNADQLFDHVYRTSIMRQACLDIHGDRAV
jgi:hypothetical protein